MLEIEMKFAVDNLRQVEDMLRQQTTSEPEQRADADRYFNAPDRDFAKTDEALRLRSIGSKNFITYKGPKIDAQTKTRTELELPLPEGPHVPEQFGRLLQHLGYRFVAQVEKCRTIYHLRRAAFDLEVCLDDVRDVGTYVELEIVAPAEQLDAARAALLEVAGELGLTRSERRSYLQLLLEKRA